MEQSAGGLPVKPMNLGEQPQEGDVGERSWLGKHATEALGAGVFQPTAVAMNRHAHLGLTRHHVQLREQPTERWVRALIVHNEARVDGDSPRVRSDHVVGVGVAAQTTGRFIEGDVVALLQDVGSREARYSGPDNRCSLSPCL